jgi:hypothetical protein
MFELFLLLALCVLNVAFLVFGSNASLPILKRAFISDRVP